MISNVVVSFLETRMIDVTVTLRCIKKAVDIDKSFMNIFARYMPHHASIVLCLISCLPFGKSLISSYSVLH